LDGTLRRASLAQGRLRTERRALPEHFVVGAAKIESMFKRRKTDQIPAEGNSQDVERYRRAWHSYVARRNLVVVLFLSFLFVGFMVEKLKLGEAKDFAILLAWIAVYLAGAWRLTEWRCPRCGKVFGHRLWTQRCISCDLSKDEVVAVVRGK
jgi:hypothetical protein